MYICIFLAILCTAYGTVVMAARTGSSFFAMWYLLAAVWAAAAAVLRFGLIRRIPWQIRGAAAVIIMAGLAVLIVLQLRILDHFRDAGAPDLDILIVLGAQVKESGPSTVLRYRLDTAAAYLRKNPRTLCIVSGGKGANESFSEAEGMKDYLIRAGIAGERILTEDRSRNTSENIAYSMQLLDPERDRTGFVTNDFHVYRGYSLAKKAGIRNVCGIAAPSTPLFLPNNMMRECVGIIKDVLMGNMRLF